MAPSNGSKLHATCDKTVRQMKVNMHAVRQGNRLDNLVYQVVMSKPVRRVQEWHDAVGEYWYLSEMRRRYQDSIRHGSQIPREHNNAAGCFEFQIINIFLECNERRPKFRYSPDRSKINFILTTCASAKQIEVQVRSNNTADYLS
jgi:hypothetical protein